jgi:hypothetical protein
VHPSTLVHTIHYWHWWLCYQSRLMVSWWWNDAYEPQQSCGPPEWNRLTLLIY